ncbi:MAG TPA: metal ABC transporter substrate-binding protein [Limnochordales bacterium]
MSTRLRPAWAVVGLALVLMVASFALGGLPWNARGGRAAPREPVQVVTSTSVFADLIANVGGERVRVVPLLGRGTDPHAWEPTSRDIRALNTADMFIYNGLGLEPWAPRLVASAGRPDLVVLELAAGLAPEPAEHDDHDVTWAHEHAAGGGAGHGDPAGVNPHLWLDVTYAIQYVRRIEQALASRDPEGAQYYRARADAYVAELEELDRWFQAQMRRIPPERRVLITYHNAYAYMAERYGLELAGSLVQSPDHEPSAQVMARLVRVMREKRVPAVFVEPQINPRFAEALAAEAGARIGVLYTDSLTDDVPSYIAMMRANAETLVALLE